MFFTLFGAVAVVGVLGAGIMSTMRGPLTTMVEVNRIEETKAEMAVSLRLILLRGSQQDGDTLTEPTAPSSCTTGVAGAGCVPGNTGAKQKDAWGTGYAYCAWNNGSENAASGGILKGEVSTNNVAVALISAGPDRKFDTDCQANPGSGAGFQVLVPNGGGGDDIVRSYNYNDAVAGSDGLWALVDSGPTGDFARVEEEISVGGGAGSFSRFEGGADFGDAVTSSAAIRTDLITPNTTASTPQDFIEFTGSILLPEVGDVSCSGNEGSIAFDETEQIVAFCDGDSWEPLGKKLWIEDDNGIRNNDDLAPHVGIGTGSSGAYSLFVDGGTATDELKATSTVDFDATLNVDGASTLNNTLSVIGNHATNLGGTLGVVGNTELDAALGVDGESEFRADVTVISDVFIEKTATGGGNLTAEDAITATEGDITATAGDVVATAGNVTATAGNVEAVAGDVTAGKDITADKDITATNGNITASAGNIIATTGNIEAVAGKIIGESFHRGDGSALDFSDIEACDPETEKTVWSAVSGWNCEPDNGTGSGTDGESTLKDVLARGNDAEGADIDDVGTISADEFCDNETPESCLSASDMIAGSSIWKKDGPGGATGEIYFDGTNVGIGTNDPARRLHLVGTGGINDDLLIESFNDADTNSGALVMVRSRGTSAAKTPPLQNDMLGVVSGRGWDGTQYKGDASIFMRAQRNFADSVDSAMQFYTTNEGAVAQRMLLSAEGNLGIGTAWMVPGITKLDVAGTVRMADGGEACSDADSIDHTGSVRFKVADNAFEVCADEAKGWESLFSSGDKGGLWEPNESDPPTHIRYDDALGGMRVGHVPGAPPVTGWQLNAASSIVFTNGKVGALEYCKPDGTNCFDPAVLAGVISDPLSGYSSCGNDELLAWDGDSWECSAGASAGLWSNDGPEGPGEIYYATNFVGIGTNDPAAALHIKHNATTLNLEGTDHTYIQFYPEGFAAGRKAFFGFPDVIGAAPYMALENERDGSPHDLVLHDTGKIGIGTGDPKTKLEVAGTLRIGDGTELCNSVDHEGGLKYDADGNFYMCRDSVAGWELLGSGSGGGSGGGGGKIVTICTNENSDGDGTDDIAVCTGAAAELTTAQTGVDYSFLGCRRSTDNLPLNGFSQWTGTTWRVHNSSTWYTCTDGSARIIDNNATGGGYGGGSGQDVSFRVNKGGTNQTVSANTWTTLTWNTEEFDTNNNFAANRFTPTVAGKYIINASVHCPAVGFCGVTITKNGTGVGGTNVAGSSAAQQNASVIVDMNGTTDYVEAQGFTAGTSIGGGTTVTQFAGALIGGGGGGGSDTLAGLSCTAGQVVKWSGSAWACADDYSESVEPAVIILTSGTSWTVPADWNDANNAVHVIGAGGGGGEATGSGGQAGGGGGGAYARIDNFTATPGASISYVIGSGGAGGSGTDGGDGGDTYFNGGSLGASSVGAEGGKGGLRGNGVAGGAGGSASNSVGDVTYDGGGGGTGGATSGVAGGGGGAGGPNGAGETTPDADGGTGGGGSGGTGGAPVNNSPGGNGAEWTTAGSGGGAGGANNGNVGAAGGLYGGGGSGGRGSGYDGGAGASGVIVITYTPAGVGGGGSGSSDTLSSLSCSANQTVKWDGSDWVCTAMASGGGGTTKTIILTAGSNWTVPSDWNSSNNSIEAIGGGGGGFSGSGSGSNKETGGGGGEYRKLENFSASSGEVIPYVIGAGGAFGPSNAAGSNGGDTIFNTSSLIAKGGGGGGTEGLGIGGAGGTGGSGGTIYNDGGKGGDAENNRGGGGGGAGGPDGPGGDGGVGTSSGSSAGGGGANGGADGQEGALGGAGGHNRFGVGGGVPQGGAGTDGGGGAGASGNISGGAGSEDSIWMQTSNGFTAGPGGGGAGGRGNGADGGPGGGFGAGGGGGDGDGGTGSPGIIVITYTTGGSSGGSGSDTLASLTCGSGDVAAWDGDSWECVAGGGDSLWTDSGDGYLEYSVVDAGVKLNKISGLPNPDVPLASGLTWDTDTSTLFVEGNIEITGEFTDASDIRLKEDVRDLGEQGSLLEKIRAIDPVSFRMKAGGSGRTEFGVIAQQLETVFPELVFTQEGEAGLKSVNYSGLIAPLIGAAQELDASVRAENQALRAQIAAMKDDMALEQAELADLKDQVALLNRIMGSQAAKAEMNWQLILFMLFSAGIFGLIVVRYGRTDRK